MDTKEKIAIMQAFVDGKKIEYYSKIDNDWITVSSEPDWDWFHYKFRIKPDSKFRPYTFEELQTEMVKGNFYEGERAYD